MRLALMGQKLGHQVFIVVEKINELDILLKVAEEMGVTPTAGVRIKLTSTGSGKWAESRGGAEQVRAQRLAARAGARQAPGRPGGSTSSS